MSHVTDKDRLIALAIAKRKELIRKTCFDPADENSKPTVAQQEFFDDFSKYRQQYIIAGNQSGKSQSCSRLTAWILEENHPFWTRPAEWGKEPLLIVVAGRTGKIIEESLAAKIKSYLREGTYKEVKIGNILQKIEHENGNRIIFQSLENPEHARERVQSYVAHFVWLDEMPPLASLMTELQMRTNSRNGIFVASFTPLVTNAEIKKMVDAVREPSGKVYKFKMFDNPLYHDPRKQQDVLDSMASLPASVVATRLYGEWSQPENTVYQFIQDRDVRLPEGYSPSWRHVEAVDPAMKSKFGLTLWAEQPSTGHWYCVREEYLTGYHTAGAFLDAVVKLTQGLNIVRRVSDPHEAWFLGEASSRGISYMVPYDKNSRKNELIKNFQKQLGVNLFIAPWCPLIQEELTTCRWADGDGSRIVNASTYHLLDTAQYFTDCKPKSEVVPQVHPWHQELREANQKRKMFEAHVAKITSGGRVQRKLFSIKGGSRW